MKVPARDYKSRRVVINKYFLIAMGIVILYLLPYLLLGENVHIRVIDELDGAISNIVMIIRSGEALNFDLDAVVVKQMMNGLPINSLYPTNLNVVIWLYLIFKPFTAYGINEFLVRLVALFGMYLFLKKHVLGEKEESIIVAGSSLCFAILPFYSIYGLTIAGQPLLFYAFFNIRNRESRWSDLLIISTYPFYSLMAQSGVFILFFLFLLFIADLYRKRTVNYKFLGSILLFVAVSLVANYSLLYSIFISTSFVSQRVEIRRFTKLTMEKSIRNGVNNFINIGHFHSLSLQFLILRLMVPAALVIGFLKGLKAKVRLIILLLLTIFSISIWHGLWEWRGLLPLKNMFGVLHNFDAGRFHFFHPLLWYVVFAISLSLIIIIRHGKYVVGLLLILQIFYLFANNLEYSFQIDKVAGKTLNNWILKKSRIKLDRHPNPEFTYKEFYSEALFKEIDAFISRPKDDYRVVSIGMHPSVSQYNGFYTLDGYSSNYPLSYKHEFRKIIENELEKSAGQKEYFDEWGSRCYVFVAEFDKLPGAWRSVITKDKSIRDNVKIRDLDLDTTVLRQMGGEYILSSVEILNAQKNRLNLLKIFKDKASPWKIYLYEVEEHGGGTHCK